MRRIFCYFFVIEFKKVFPVFPTASSNYLIYIDIYAFCFTTRSRPTTMRRKISNIIHYEDIFNPSSLCIYESSFKWFSEGDNELACGQPLMLISPGNIFLKTCYNTILSSYALYSNLYISLSFLECLSTTVGIKVTV